MTKLVWGGTKPTPHTLGVSHGVLYFLDGSVIPWSGLLNVTENLKSETKDVYFEGSYIANSRTNEDFHAEVECFTYPIELFEKRVLGFSYQTGSDQEYRVHLVYNPQFVLSAKGFNTFSDNVDATIFSIELYTTPRKLTGFAPTAHVYLDSKYDNGTGAFSKIVERLYGTAGSVPSFMSPDLILAASHNPELLDFELVIIDYGDGTISYDGDTVVIYADGTFSVDHTLIRAVGTDEFGATIL